MNPWWEGEKPPPTPSTRRHLVRQIHRRLDANLAPVLVVRGPRQIGKSTAQVQVIDDLLARGVPPTHILRVQFDDLKAFSTLGDEPILRLIDWYERDFLGVTINRVARARGEVFLFLDEVQNLSNWDVQLKFLVDQTRVRVVVTGSSALRIERERAVARDEAFRAFAERGGYPLVHQRVEVPWALVADQLNETVIKRVAAGGALPSGLPLRRPGAQRGASRARDPARPERERGHNPGP